MESTTLPSLFIRSEPVLELPAKHNQLARLLALGWSKRAAAEKLGMGEGSVSIISRSPLFQSVVDEFTKGIDKGVRRALDTLAEAAPKAAEALVNIMEHPADGDQKIQKEASVEILKGAGASRSYEAPVGVTINISEAKLNLIMATLKEIR
jgi:hypothetical protein